MALLSVLCCTKLGYCVDARVLYKGQVKKSSDIASLLLALKIAVNYKISMYTLLLEHV